jgi:tetratricopeptide (TPR) repeat protein
VLADRYGLELSTSSQAARDAYIEGADCMLAAIPGPRACFERALAADPGFAIAQIALARALFLTATVPEARAAAARARELAQRATVRERSHVDALAQAIEGRPADALAATKTHVALYPRDAMVLTQATGVFGLIGFSGRQDREPELLELLRGLAPHYGADWWFLAVLAFASIECGELDEAVDMIEQSLERNPRNAHGAHIRAHLLYEQGRTQAALDYLEGWMPEYAREGLMHCHLSWHLALSALDCGLPGRAWEVYLAGVHPGGAWGPALNVVTDSAAFLWRAELAGHERRPELWGAVHEHATASFPKTGVAFADVHCAVASAACGDTAALDRLAAELRERVASGTLPAGDVVPALANAFGAFARSDWDDAIARFEQALPATVRIGGSRAQRDLVAHSLVAAYIKAGRTDAARKLIARRLDRRAPVNVAGFAMQ